MKAERDGIGNLGRVQYDCRYNNASYAEPCDRCNLDCASPVCDEPGVMDTSERTMTSVLVDIARAASLTAPHARRLLDFVREALDLNRQQQETVDPWDALRRIRNEGKVCDQYEACDHRACQSSYTAWAIADEALERETADE